MNQPGTNRISGEHAAVISRLTLSVDAATDQAGVFNAAVKLVAKALRAPLAKILEYTSDTAELVVRAGVGWHEGVVGVSTIPATTASQAGYTLLHRDAVVVEDLTHTRRFTDAVVLRSHGVVSGLSITLLVDGGAFGVLSVHDTHKREYSAADLQFVDQVARIVGRRLSELRRGSE